MSDKITIELNIEDFEAIIKSLNSTKNYKKVELLKNSIVDSFEGSHLKQLHKNKVDKSKSIIDSEIERLKGLGESITKYKIAKNTGLNYKTVSKYVSKD